MAISLKEHDRADVMRDIARKILSEADKLDGTMPCTCEHQLICHDPAGWNMGWCDGSLTVDGNPPTDDTFGGCKCEGFEAW